MAENSVGLPDIFDYLDYRLYLSDWLKAKKAKNPNYSYEVFTQKAGLGSKGTLHNVISGRRTPNASTLSAFAAAMDLTVDERDFLTLLVDLDEASTIAERRRLMEAILQTPRFRQTVVVGDQASQVKDQYLQSWICVVIRELARTPGFKHDPDWVLSRILPTCGRQAVVEALDALLRLGLLTETQTGQVHTESVRVATEPEVAGESIHQYHQAFLRLAAESLDNAPATDRHIEGGTILLSEALVGELKAEIGRFMLRWATAADVPDPSDARVFQLQVQLFPLTRPTTHAADGARARQREGDGRA